MVLLSKQKGLIPIVLAAFVGVVALTTGWMIGKTTPKSDTPAQTYEQAHASQQVPDSDVGVK